MFLATHGQNLKSEALQDADEQPLRFGFGSPLTLLHSHNCTNRNRKAIAHATAYWLLANFYPRVAVVLQLYMARLQDQMFVARIVAGTSDRFNLVAVKGELGCSIRDS